VPIVLSISNAVAPAVTGRIWSRIETLVVVALIIKVLAFSPRFLAHVIGLPHRASLLSEPRLSDKIPETGIKTLSERWAVSMQMSVAGALNRSERRAERASAAPAKQNRTGEPDGENAQ
jgi:hypothetical protein